MNTNEQNLLLIFTRNPELGKCKTRLAATIGDEKALEVYKYLLNHTAEITQNLNVEKYVYYSEEIWQNDVWKDAIFTKKIQQGTDLGERMLNAFTEGFSTGFKKIIIIGSDLFAISQTDIEHAFAALDQNDFVIGPAEDGGFYLLGMKTLKKELFYDKDWGKDTVLDSTMQDLKNESFAQLEIKNDVDYYEDIKDVPEFQSILNS